MCEELLKLMEPEMREAKRKAEEEGRKAGMEKGIEKGMDLSIAIITKLREGKSIEEIAKETGVDVKMVENIRASIEG